MNGNPTLLEKSTPDIAGKFGIQITPTKGEGINSLSSKALTAPFRNTVALGIEKYNSESPEQTMGLFLYSKGVRSGRLEEKVNSSEILTAGEKESFLRSAETMRTLEEAYPLRTSQLSTAWREPEIEIGEFVPQPLPQVQQIAFQHQDTGPLLSSENFSLGPVGNYAKQFVGDFAHKQVDKLVSKATKKIAEKVTKTVAKEAVKTGAKVAAKVGARVGATAIGQALGSSIPVIGNIAAFILTEVVPRILGAIKKAVNKILKAIFGEGDTKKQLGYLLLGGSALLLGLGFTGPAALMAVAGAGITVSAVGLATVGATITGALASLAAITVSAIAAPVLIAIVVVPLLVAFILFIINSSAYVVPPSPNQAPGLVESPYIGVEKTVNPAGPFQNSQLPLTVSYTVTVTAKRGTLTNIRFQNECTVIRRTGASIPSCQLPTPPIPTVISPIQPFEFSYIQTYDGSNFTDSLVVDVFTITADAEEQLNTQAAASVGIKIGNPPDQCPLVWPTNSGYLTQGAYSPSNCSHHSLEAIDIGVNNVPVFAGHSGTASVYLNDPCLGNFIRIASICQGKGFFSTYAHLEGVSISGGTVTMGQQIGLSGNTGSCTTGPHLHYGFKYSTGGDPSYPNNPPYMWIPFIPKNVPRGCCTVSDCATTIP